MKLWIKSGNEYIKEYDENGKLIHSKNPFYGYEKWYEYDKNGNKIHFRDSDGLEEWTEYDDDGNKIHYKDSDGAEYWYDSDRKVIYKKNSDGTEEGQKGLFFGE